MKVLDSSAVHGDPNVAICGDDNQMLTITLQPTQSIIVQPGCMMWCEEGIHHEVSTGSLSSALTRACCANEDMFRVQWGQRSSDTSKDFSHTVANLRDGRLGSTDGILCDSKEGGRDQLGQPRESAGMDPDLQFSVERAGRRGGGTVGKAVFGGQGLFLCTIRGRGLVFLNGSGTIVEKNLQAGETIIVDQNAVLAWASSVNFSYRFVHNFGMMCCGGEGFANTTLTGPGYVILQSVTTPAGAQANPLSCVVCLCFLLFFIVFSGASTFIGSVATHELDDENRPSTLQSLENEETGDYGRRLLQNLTYEVGRRVLQNFTIFS